MLLNAIYTYIYIYLLLLFKPYCLLNIFYKINKFKPRKKLKLSSLYEINVIITLNYSGYKIYIL